MIKAKLYEVKYKTIRQLFIGTSKDDVRDTFIEARNIEIRWERLRKTIVKVRILFDCQVAIDSDGKVTQYALTHYNGYFGEDAAVSNGILRLAPLSES